MKINEQMQLVGQTHQIQEKTLIEKAYRVQEATLVD